MSIKARLFSLDASGQLNHGTGWILLVLGLLGAAHAACVSQGDASKVVAEQAPPPAASAQL
jgi:hypothetical protein